MLSSLLRGRAAIRPLVLLAFLGWTAAGCGHDLHDPGPRPARPASTTSVQAHMAALVDTIGPRVAGTPGEARARDHVAKHLASLGYAVEIQPFPFLDDRSSANVIATRPGTAPGRMIVGAHYDSVPAGRGAADNASGTAMLLALAETLAGEPLPFTLVLVAFGAEEAGLHGSSFYVSQMSDQDVASTIGMVNLDTVIGGDHLYVHAGPADSGWLRDQALAVARALDIPLRTNPGLNPEYPAGTTGPWGDHAPFARAGITIALFESTNWEVGERDGYTQTATHGSFWHSEQDTVAAIQTAFPGRIEAQTRDLLAILQRLLTTLDVPAGAPDTIPAARPLTRSGSPAAGPQS